MKTAFAGGAALGLVFLLLAAIAPLAVDSKALRQRLVAHLEDFTGGQVTIKGDVRLKSFLTFSIEAASVEASGVREAGPVRSFTAGQAEARFGWLDLLSGEPRVGALILSNVRFKLTAPQGNWDANTAFADVLDHYNAGKLTLRDAAFETDGEALPLEVAAATLERKEGEKEITLRGSASWRGVPFNLSATRGEPEKDGAVSRAPLTISFRSSLLTARLAGMLALTPGAQFSGDVKVETADAAAAAQWLPLGWTAPASVKSVSAEGAMTWTGGELSFDGARFSLNGEKASGNLSVKVEEGCPEVEGTLAFQHLNAAMLLYGDGQAGPDAAVFKAVSPLPACVSADLRLSAEQMNIFGYKAGGAAVAVTVNGGKLDATIAEVTAFDGTLRGEASIDLSSAEPAFSIRMTAQDLDTSVLPEPLGASRWIDGRMACDAELRARGQTWPALLASLNGEAKVTVAGSDVLAPASSSGFSGRPGGRWAQTFDFGGAGRQNFNTVQARLKAENGVIAVNSLVMTGASSTLTARGRVDAVQRVLEGRAELKRDTAEDSGAGTAEPGWTMSMAGPLSDPVFTSNGKQYHLLRGAAASHF